MLGGGTKYPTLDGVFAPGLPSVGFSWISDEMPMGTKGGVA